MSTDSTKGSDKKTKPVMDVSKPGKTAPSASSRPIIVGHKTVQDTTVTEKPAEPETIEEPKVTRSGPKIVMPISDDFKPAAAEASEPESPVAAADDSAVAEEPVADTPEEPEADEVAETAKEESSVEETDTQPSGSTDSEAAVVDAVVEQADAKKAEAKASAEEEKRQKEFEKLIESKKYHVPIGGRTRRKRQGKGLIAFLALLLLLAGGYVAADKFTDLPLPYEFFNSQKVSNDSTNTSQKVTTQPGVVSEVSTKQFVSDESGLSLKYTDGWVVEQEKNTTGTCPIIYTDFAQVGGEITEGVGCPWSGEILVNSQPDAKSLAWFGVFTNSPKDLNTIYEEKISSLTSTKHEKFKTKSGLDAVIVNQPLEGSNGSYSANVYVVELAEGTYLLLENREYDVHNPEDTTLLPRDELVIDLREYTQQVRTMVESVAYKKP